MKYKNILLSLVFSVSVALLSACSNISIGDPGQSPIESLDKKTYISYADYEHYDSIESLFAQSDYVIRGKVIDTRVEWLSHSIPLTPEEEADPNTNPYLGTDQEPSDEKKVTTIYTVEAVELYKGDFGNKVLEVMQLGGETDTEIYIVEGEPEITQNIDYILFLSKSELRENAAWLLNADQSLYKVEGENLLMLPSNTLELDFEDLSRLSNKE